MALPVANEPQRNVRLNMNLSDKFHTTLAKGEDDPAIQKEAAEIVLNAPDSAERNGLLALMHHEGIGVDENLDKSFDYAAKAAEEGDGLGYFLLGYMCDNAETPDQAEGGPRQKYDHYDAERFYELCSKVESRWREEAVIWLAEYYMDSAKGGDHEIGVEYFESIADHNAYAAGALSDYYWDLVMPEFTDDKEWTSKLFKWTAAAVRLDPEEYSFRMGWLYADGLGCEQDYNMAIEQFGTAYEYGDWRGAKGIADILAELQQLDHDHNSRKECDKEIELWNERASKLREQELSQLEDETDLNDED